MRGTWIPSFLEPCRLMQSQQPVGLLLVVPSALGLSWLRVRVQTRRDPASKTGINEEMAKGMRERRKECTVFIQNSGISRLSLDNSFFPLLQMVILTGRITTDGFFKKLRNVKCASYTLMELNHFKEYIQSLLANFSGG